MDTKQKHRLSPEYVLLGFLYLQPGHGYDLHKQLLDQFGFIWHVSQSQTYNILKRLEDQGYVASITVEQEKLPPRQLFHLTDNGYNRFNNWLDAPTSCSVHYIRVEFITRLYFIQHYQPHEVQEAIRIQTNAVQMGLNQLEEMHTRFYGDQTFNHLALDLRIKLLTSIVSWLEECRDTFKAINYKHDTHE
jgi:PadR family transcriptional regulator AphA